MSIGIGGPGLSTYIVKVALDSIFPLDELLLAEVEADRRVRFSERQRICDERDHHQAIILSLSPSYLSTFSLPFAPCLMK